MWLALVIIVGVVLAITVLVGVVVGWLCLSNWIQGPVCTSTVRLDGKIVVVTGRFPISAKARDILTNHNNNS